MTGDKTDREKAEDSLLSGGERVSKGRQRDAESIHDWFMRLIARIPIRFDYRDTESGDTDDRTGFASTHGEVHALGWGLGFGLALGLSLAYSWSVTLAAGAATLRTVLYAHTGREIQVGGRGVELPAKYLGQIRRDPHYLDGGVVAGVVLGLGVVAWSGIGFWF